MYFVNTKLPEESVWAIHPGKELRELPDDNPNIFKKFNIDHYMEVRSATFCNGIYNVLNDFCHAEFLAYYTLENKSNKTYE